MNDRLFFNGQELDINPLKKIAENYQVNDLLDFSKRQTSFTNTFDLPKTHRNIDVLQGLGLVGEISNIPYELNKLTYFRNGIQVFSNARAIIKETENEFKCNAYFGNNDIFDIIESKKLSELDLSQFNHALSVDNYFKYLNGTDIIYAVADYSQMNDSVIDINYQVPSIKTAWLWDKIFAEAGFTYKYAGRGGRNDYNVFLSDLWNETYITIDGGLDTNVEKIPKTLQWDALNEVNYQYRYFKDYVWVELNTKFGKGYYRTIITYIPATTKDIVSFENVNNVENSLVNFYNNKITIKQNNYYSIEIKGSIVANSVQQLFLKIYLNDNVLSTIEIKQGIFDLNFSIRSYFKENDIVYFSFETINENNSQDVVFNTLLDFEIHLDNQEPFINFSNFWSNISQKDFIKDFVNFYGLTYKKVGNEYQFISYEELFNANPVYENFNAIEPTNFVADDWSNKFHILTKEEYSLGDYSQRNIFKYKYDNPVNTFADGVMRIDDFTLPLENTAETRLFKAPENNIFGYKSMPLYKNENGKIKNVKTDPFIFRVKKSNKPFDWKVTGGAAKPFTNEYKLATFDDLSWGEQLSKTLSLLNSVLSRINKKDVELTLNELDVKELDFFKLKYIKQLGGYFYLLKVNGFTNDETTKCELLKVPQFSTRGQFSDDFSNDFKN